MRNWFVMATLLVSVTLGAIARAVSTVKFDVIEPFPVQMVLPLIVAPAPAPGLVRTRVPGLVLIKAPTPATPRNLPFQARVEPAFSTLIAPPPPPAFPAWRRTLRSVA